MIQLTSEANLTGLSRRRIQFNRNVNAPLSRADGDGLKREVREALVPIIMAVDCLSVNPRVDVRFAIRPPRGEKPS